MGKPGERDENWVSGLVQLCHPKGPTSEIRSAKLQVSTLLLPSHVISESIRKSHPPPLTLTLLNRLMFVSTWSRQIIASHFVKAALCFLTLHMISCYRRSWPFSHSKLLNSRSRMCPVLHSLSFPIMFLDLDVGTWPTMFALAGASRLFAGRCPHWSARESCQEDQPDLEWAGSHPVFKRFQVSFLMLLGF